MERTSRSGESPHTLSLLNDKDFIQIAHSFIHLFTVSSIHKWLLFSRSSGLQPLLSQIVECRAEVHHAHHTRDQKQNIHHSRETEVGGQPPRDDWADQRIQPEQSHENTVHRV